jgi:type II secretion system protein G
VLARIRKAQEENESGFTLIELLVVMIIIGILAAIAIPVFLSQRAKAQDSAAKADVSTLGKEIATYFVDNTAAPTVAFNAAGTKYQVNGADVGNISANVKLNSSYTSTPAAATTITTTGMTSDAWCISVYNDKGSQKVYKYSAAGGLGTGQCSSVSGS